MKSAGGNPWSLAIVVLGVFGEGQRRDNELCASSCPSGGLGFVPPLSVIAYQQSATMLSHQLHRAMHHCHEGSRPPRFERTTERFYALRKSKQAVQRRQLVVSIFYAEPQPLSGDFLGLRAKLSPLGLAPRT